MRHYCRGKLKAFFKVFEAYSQITEAQLKQGSHSEGIVFNDSLGKVSVFGVLKSFKIVLDPGALLEEHEILSWSN